MQKIDPERLHNLRQKKGLSRPQLSKKAGIAEKTIQRIEKEPQPSQQKTLNRLAKALGVEPGVLTGELPLPESDKASAPDAERVQIGAQVAPKVRLAYDLIKRRYGASPTEIINMAPLFFALLAEGSLAWRREKLKEVGEAKSRLEQIDGFWRGGTLGSVGEGKLRDEGVAGEEDSIAKADLFGEHLISDTSIHDFFDPSTDNPFASYLRELKAKLGVTGDVNVGSGNLMFGSPLKFPDYDICCDELDRIANGSTNAKRTLETGHARLSEIPEDASSEERAKWLEDRLPDIFKGKTTEDISSQTKEKLEAVLESEKDPDSAIKRTTEALHEQENQLKERFDSNRYAEEATRSVSTSIEEADSQETNSDSDIEKGGDDQ